MRDLFFLEIAVVVFSQVPQVGNKSVACRRQQPVFRVELSEVYLFHAVTVLTSLAQVDSQVRVVLKRLNLLVLRGHLSSVKPLHQLNLSCHHPVHVLVLLLQEVSLLRGVGTELAHHTGHLVVGQLLAWLSVGGSCQGLCSLVRLLGLSLLLLEECLQLIILSANEGVLEPVMGHSKLLRGLLLVVVGHLSLQDGCLLRLLL